MKRCSAAYAAEYKNDLANFNLRAVPQMAIFLADCRLPISQKTKKCSVSSVTCMMKICVIVL